LDTMRQIHGAARPRWVWTACKLTQALFGPPRSVRVEFEGLDNLPAGPVIVAANHTHTYDFLPLRAFLFLRHHLFGSSWVKARAWQNPVERYLFSRTGNVPLVSKGYVLAADFLRLVGRRPTEAEYRALRNHLDRGDALPDDAVYAQVQDAERHILGWSFTPSTSTYRDAIRDCFFEMMQVSLRIARESCEAGQFQHINPQGARSSRLTEGKPGVIHASRALDLAIVPTAILGMTETFPNHGLKTRGGAITIRFGEPYTPDLDALPESYRPFDPRITAACGALLQQRTTELMGKIDALCSEAYRFRSDFVCDATSGTARFL
jgi:1-acyl-sn-glycerol-3-phosphate acyltransferase